MIQRLSKTLGARPMNGRDADEAHRAATPLELLFDLVSVIAIASAAAGLHHAVAHNHIGHGVPLYLAAFFMIWWAWMNYTWFASAYDNDDPPFRLLTLVSMAGALTIAAGIPAFNDSTDLRAILAGFIVMRIAMVALWLRAASADAAGRRTAVFYAVGIFLVQVYWVAIVVARPENTALFWSLFVAGVALELSVPWIAEKQRQTSWHRHHIIERYGLLNIIVLGETLLAASLALQEATAGAFSLKLLGIAISALLVLFSMWWLYFSDLPHLPGGSSANAFVWGYGHVLIFLSGAAIGAGYAVLVDIVSHRAHVSYAVGLYAVAIPLGVYMLGLWVIQDRCVLKGWARGVLPVAAVAVLVSPTVGGLTALTTISLFAVYLRSYRSA